MGAVLDLPTRANTVPIAGNPRVSATHSHTSFCSCHTYLHTVRSKFLPHLLFSFIPPATALAASHVLSRTHALTLTRCRPSPLLSPSPSPSLSPSPLSSLSRCPARMPLPLHCRTATITPSLTHMSSHMH